jgi:hypothetical protein
MPATGKIRWPLVIGAGLAVPLLVFAAAIWSAEYGVMTAHLSLGLDYRGFVVYGQRLIDTGSLYLPAQLTGPYEWATLPADPLVAPFSPATLPCVYPPLVAFLAVPAALLPWPVWWVAPALVLAFCFARWRPASWTWPILAALLAWPDVSATVIVGGSAMWMTAAIAAGLYWGWPILFVLIKPTLAPLVLIGLRRRSFWIAVVVVGVLSVPLLGDWLRYPAVVLNAGAPGPGYFAANIPFIALPVIAWLGRRRTADRPPEVRPLVSAEAAG